MKITLYMAISVDGYIAKKDGDSDWVSEVDNDNFMQQVTEKGCIIVGRRTFDQYQGELYPVKGIVNIVLTKNKIENYSADNVFYAQSPHEAVEIAQRQGCKEVLLVGGGTTNGLFLKENLINEIILSVHPLILGDGIKLFEGVEKFLSLSFIGQKKLGEDLIHLYYKIGSKVV